MSSERSVKDLSGPYTFRLSRAVGFEPATSLVRNTHPHFDYLRHNTWERRVPSPPTALYQCSRLVLGCFRRDHDAISTRPHGRGGVCACDQCAYPKGSRLECPRQ